MRLRMSADKLGAKANASMDYYASGHPSRGIDSFTS
jgi:hypothetical protein